MHALEGGGVIQYSLIVPGEKSPGKVQVDRLYGYLCLGLQNLDVFRGGSLGTPGVLETNNTQLVLG